MNAIICPHCREEFILARAALGRDEKLVVSFSCGCSSWDGHVLRTNVHDPTKVKEGPMKLPEPSINRNVRSDLADDVQKYWVGHKESNIGLQYLRLKDGIIEVPQFSFERRDLLLVQFGGVCNAFVEPDGRIQIDPWSGVVLNSADRAEIERIVAGILPEHAEYFERENRFLQEKPWLQVQGMTPEASVQKFAELGWGER